MGFGISAYGLGPYGSVAAVTTITVIEAWAISTHGVRVGLSSEPLHSDTYADGDALNPTSWQIVNADTGHAITVVAAEMFDTTQVDLTTLDALGDHLETHAVTAVGLLSIDGFVVTDPLSATFLGVVQTIDPIESVRSEDFRDRDLAAQPFQSTRGTGAGGALSIAADGDFETESGLSLTRKLVLRRLSTRRGAFRHLPQFGIEGFAEKEPIVSSSDLSTRLREIEDQALQEPDAQSARATGSLDRSGVAFIQLAVQCSGGTTVTMRMGAIAGRLVEA